MIGDNLTNRHAWEQGRSAGPRRTAAAFVSSEEGERVLPARRGLGGVSSSTVLAVLIAASATPRTIRERSNSAMWRGDIRDHNVGWVVVAPNAEFLWTVVRSPSLDIGYEIGH